MFIDSGPPLIFTLVFVVILSVAAFTLIKGMVTWSHNLSQPVESVNATVVTKRTEVRGRSEGRTWTTYFCTFELEDGTRQEFAVPDRQYGLLVEGDRGN